MMRLLFLMTLGAPLGCGSSDESTPRGAIEQNEPLPSENQAASGQSNTDQDLTREISWSANVKATLEPLIESQLGLRNRVETKEFGAPIKIVFLELPPRTVPKAMPSGEIKNILNPNGAPSRLKLLIRDVIEASRLEIAGFELFNGKLNPDSPTPFQ